jgi:hypothetical protein
LRKRIVGESVHGNVKVIAARVEDGRSVYYFQVPAWAIVNGTAVIRRRGCPGGKRRLTSEGLTIISRQKLGDQRDCLPDIEVLQRSSGGGGHRCANLWDGRASSFLFQIVVASEA